MDRRPVAQPVGQALAGLVAAGRGRRRAARRRGQRRATASAIRASAPTPSPSASPARCAMARACTSRATERRSTCATRSPSLVNEGRLSDDEILAEIQAAFPNDILLVPPADGVNVLVWALPAVAVICAGAGLVVAFRRWRRGSTVDEPNDDDRAIVSSALAAGDRDGR